MKISKIEAKNFRGLSSAALFPEQINILAGPNGIGKTSLLEAVRTAITGKTPADALKIGSANGYVLADVTGLGPIQRTFSAAGTNKTLMCGKTATAKSVAETLEEHFGSKETMSIMFSSQVMESMMGADMSEYLLNEGFLKNDMTIDKILSLCTLSTAAQEELSMMLPGAPEVISLNEIQEAYDAYFESRKDKKRELKEAEAAAKYDGPIPARTLKDVATEQEAVSKEIGRISSLSATYEKLKKAFEIHQANLKSLTEKFAPYAEVKMPSKSQGELLAGKIKANQDLTREVTASIRICTADAISLKKILDALAQPICPISNKLICGTDKTGIRAELETQVIERKSMIVSENEKLKELAIELADLNQRNSEFVKQASDYQAKLLYKEQLEKEKSSPISEPEPFDATALAALNLRAEALRREAEVIVRYDFSKDAETKVELYQNQVSLYDELVTELSPKGGVRQKVLEHSVAPLQEYCNQKMKKVLPRYEMVLDVSDGFKVLLSDKTTGESISYASASNGERLRTAYVLMSMFNALNQFRILILDNLNDLDDESCEMLLELIQADMDDYDHVFLASANNNILTAAKELGIEFNNVFRS